MAKREIAARFELRGETGGYNPIRANVRMFSSRYSKRADIITRRLQAEIDKGRTPEQAIQAVFGDGAIDAALRKDMMNAVVGSAKAAAGAGASEVGLKHWFMENVNGAAGLPAKAQMADLIDTSIVSQKAEQVRQLAAATTKAKNQAIEAIRAGDASPRAFANLERSIRASLAVGGDEAGQRAAQAAVGKIKRELERAGLEPGPRVEKIITRLDETVTVTMDRAEKAALRDAVYNDARISAERIVRTESASAYEQAWTSEALADDDVVGWRSVLSEAHDIVDICDWWATADLYGMGPGVYPKDNGPSIPYHPNCMCLKEEVFLGETDVGREKLDDEAARKQLSRLPKKDQEALMGKGGASRFREDPGSWRNELNNYREPERKTAAIPLAVLHGDE